MLFQRSTTLFVYSTKPGLMSWGDFVMVNFIPILLFSLETSFVPLKLHPNTKWGRRKSDGTCSQLCSNHRDKTFGSLSWCVLSASQTARERDRDLFLCFLLVFLTYGRKSFPKTVSLYLELFKPALE